MPLESLDCLSYHLFVQGNLFFESSLAKWEEVHSIISILGTLIQNLKEIETKIELQGLCLA